MTLHPRNLHHVCVQTPDYAASLDFYVRVLGLHCVKETRDFHGREVNAWLRLPGQQAAAGMMIELQTGKRQRPLQPWSADQAGPVHLALLVDNVHAAYATTVALGWTAFKTKNGAPVYEVGNSWLCKIVAPEGTEIELRDVAEL